MRVDFNPGRRRFLGESAWIAAGLVLGGCVAITAPSVEPSGEVLAGGWPKVLPETGVNSDVKKIEGELSPKFIEDLGIEPWSEEEKMALNGAFEKVEDFLNLYAPFFPDHKLVRTEVDIYRMSELVEEKMRVNDSVSGFTAARAVIDEEMSNRVNLPIGIYWHGSFEGNDPQVAVLAHDYVYHMAYGLSDDRGGPFSSFGVQYSMAKYLETGKVVLDPDIHDLNLQKKSSVFR